MTSIFPVSASVGQEFSGYNFDGESWNLIGNEFNPTSFSSSPPLNPKAGDLWVDSDEDVDIIDDQNLVFQNDLNDYLSLSSASTNYATKIYADNSASVAAAALVDAAPSTLNTLNELAAALGDDSNFASTVSTSLGNKLDISTASATYLTQTAANSNFALRNGPAFSAWNSTATSIGATPATVKIGFQTEEFDTNNNFDTTLSRFTPTVAGYYQIDVLITLYLATAGALFTPVLYKNGSEFKFGGTALSSAINFPRANISVLVYANGATDYFEIFAGHSMGTAVNTYNVQNQTYFQAAYVRGA